MDSYLGRTIKHDLINTYGVTVIPAGSVLNTEHLELIRKQRISTLDLVFIDSDQEMPSCLEKTHRVVEVSKDLFNSFRLTRKVPLADIRKDVVPVVLEISQHRDIFALFEAIQGKDDY